ncbi:signal peptidase complex catalytic subunit SEC11A isoform X1 [Ochotona curzoniae]|uniref:signal peptidase complex catalytic subunit SEC11A isoform X1 n=1 Tax=Ochotona curzoniae TaxID=130825 RepID=UPI001B34EE94|nr:signal peptidase complex catalytic subunit SEC11A isoform X1 [Ochotona curzoniae]
MLSLDFLDDVRRMNKRQLYYQVLNFGMIVSSALMIWKGLMVITGSESPIVVVLSGSMEPAFHRGDLLFLTNRVDDPIRVGEIVVFRIEGREIPIVHRVLKIHEKQNGHIKFLTKGDNNAVDDRGLYKQGQHWLEKKDVVGRARGMQCSFCWDCSCWSIGSKKLASLPLEQCRSFCYRTFGVASGL